MWQKCHYCNKRADTSHHIVKRANKYLRHYHKNSLALCFECHRELHDGHLTYEIPEELLILKNILLKQFLVENGMTKQEFLKDRYDELNFIIRGEY